MRVSVEILTNQILIVEVIYKILKNFITIVIKVASSIFKEFCN